MKHKINSKYLTIAIYSLIVILFSIFFFLVCYNFGSIVAGLSFVLRKMRSVFYGIIIALTLFPFYSLFAKAFSKIFEKKAQHRKTVAALSIICTYISVIIIIAIIIISPIICGFVETYRLIKASIVKNEQKDKPLTDQQIRRLERERKQKEMEEWRDNRIKAFHYEGKAPFHFDRDIYLYLENTHNESLNQCIERNLEIIDNIFKKYGFRFVYLPKWKPDRTNIRLANISRFVIFLCLV